MDIKKYCEYLYHSLYIPIYLYDHKELTTCFPAQEKDTFPPPIYLSTLWETEKKLTYTITESYSYYGCIQVENSTSCIVIGPISTIPYTKETLQGMRKEFSPEESRWESFCIFFHNIPTLNLDTFLNTLLLINYTVNHTELSKKDVEHPVDSQLHTSINREYSKNSYASKEEGLGNNSYTIESELFRYIERGNLEGLKKFEIQIMNTKVGTIAPNNLRQLKNTFIVTITLATRAAIKGGLTPSIAYKLSDVYIQQVERLTNMDAVNSLLGQVMYDFTNRTANSIIPLSADHTLHQVVKFVRENTNKHITVADVADLVGLNPSYLSRKVKNELGFDLGTFIRQCKLEEAKDLLAFSDKSISEISNFLCFSSQSHFQKSFKNQFGITPQTYRKSV